MQHCVDCSQQQRCCKAVGSSCVIILQQRLACMSSCHSSRRVYSSRHSLANHSQLCAATHILVLVVPVQVNAVCLLLKSMCLARFGRCSFPLVPPAVAAAASFATAESIAVEQKGIASSCSGQAQP